MEAVYESKNTLVRFLLQNGFEEELFYTDSKYEDASYIRIDDSKLLVVYEVLKLEDINPLKKYFLLNRGLSYCCIIYNKRTFFFRNFGDGKFFLYSETTKNNISKKGKLRNISNNFDFLFYRKDISSKFYEEFKRKRDIIATSINNNISPEKKYLLAQKIFERIFFIYFLCHKTIIKVNNNPISGENFFNILLQSEDFLENLQNIFYYFNNIDKANELRINNYTLKIPYLNGGLFRPDPIESNLNLNMNHTDWMNVFSFLNNYHWIIENDVDYGIEDEEKILTPEILGKVYERSVVEWGLDSFEKSVQKSVMNGEERKTKGVFYTPEDVTNYVTYEAFNNYINDVFHTNYENIDMFLKQESNKNIIRLNNLLEDIKIIDPACGSGAFLIKAAEILYYLKIRTLSIKKDDVKYYDVKLKIITDNIFGVDILEGAIEISKLRLWLWLVSDYDGEDQVEPLPNIEYNLRVGNSLLGWCFETLTQAPLHSPLTKATSNLFLGLMTFSNPSIRKSLGLAKEKLDSRNISDHIQSYQIIYDIYKTEHGLTAGSLKSILEQIHETIYNSTNIAFLEYINNKVFNSRRLLSTNKLSKSELLKLTPFHWSIDFPHIMSDNGGFDVVIGNPPWGVSVLKPMEKKIYLKMYKIEKSNEISAYFLEREIQILKEGGSFSNIIAESICVNKNTTNARDQIRSNLSNPKLIFIGTRPSKIFTDVEKRVCIINGIKNTSKISSIRTTRNIRFNASERATVLHNLEFESTQGLLLGSKIGMRNDMEKTRLPKVGNKKIYNILLKLKNVSNEENIIQDIIAKNGEFLEWRASGGYWLHSLYKFPYSSSKIRKLFFKEKTHRDFVILIINSSLFYLFWVVYGNNRDLQIDMINKFPIPKIERLRKVHNETAIITEKVVNRLLSSFNPEAGRMGQFATSYCKGTINEIDEHIGKLYGLSQSQIEYIKNYDSHIRPST